MILHQQDWEDFFAASDDDKVHSFFKLQEPIQCEFTPGEKTKPHEMREEEEVVVGRDVHGEKDEENVEGQVFPQSALTDSGLIESPPPSMTALVAPEPQDEEVEELIEMSPSDELTNNEAGKDQPEASDEEGVVEE